MYDWNTYFFKQDIEDLCRLFVLATDDRKTMIAEIIDTAYSLLNSGNDERLYSILREEFLQGIKKRREKAAELLGIDPELIE